MSCILRPALSLRWLGLTLIPLLAACATNGRATDQGNGCAWARPILVAQGDVLTDLTARQILAHNETGRRLCGWQSRLPKEE